MNMQAVRITVVVLVVVLLYGSRLTKGAVRQTPEGLSFGMKPFVMVTRLLALFVYIGYFIYTLRVSQANLPWWFPVLVLVVACLSSLQLPGTIVLGPDALSQRFWLLKTKVIRYDQVVTVQVFGSGRAIRVSGDNRTTITHTNNHSAADEFKAEMVRRTGKQLA